MNLKDTVKKIVKKAMKVDLGEEGLTKSWQKEFPKETKCVHCGGEARVAFVAHEMGKTFKGPYVCEMYKNKPQDEELWMHDACAVAVYFCKKCLEPTALANQA